MLPILKKSFQNIKLMIGIHLVLYSLKIAYILIIWKQKDNTYDYVRHYENIVHIVCLILPGLIIEIEEDSLSISLTNNKHKLELVYSKW